MANVGVKYTGVGGNVTTFSATSPSDAIARLSGIRGYRRDKGDDLHGGLAQGWRERHKARASEQVSKQGFVGKTSGKHYASQNGIVSTKPSVVDVRVVGKNIVKTTQDSYIAEDGKTVGVGPKRDETVGTIPVDANASGSNVGGSVSVVIGTKYDISTHQLYNIIGKISVKNGTLVLEKTGESVITTAVQETVAQ